MKFAGMFNIGWKMKHQLMKFFKWLDLSVRPILNPDHVASVCAFLIYASLLLFTACGLGALYKYDVLTITVDYVIGIGNALFNVIGCYFLYLSYKKGPSKTGRLDVGVWCAVAMILSIQIGLAICIMGILTKIIGGISCLVAKFMKWLSEAGPDKGKY